jgi:hypothetical protein
MSMTTDHLDARVDLLHEIFRAIENPADWRAPINAIIAANLKDLVAESILFMTATVARFTDLGDGRLQVEADGYRNGPAGP